MVGLTPENGSSTGTFPCSLKRYWCQANLPSTVGAGLKCVNANQLEAGNTHRKHEVLRRLIRCPKWRLRLGVNAS